MVCKLKVKDRNKCYKYFPDDKSYAVKLEDFKITLDSSKRIHYNFV